jgi:hypothetical protein
VKIIQARGLQLGQLLHCEDLLRSFDVNDILNTFEIDQVGEGNFTPGSMELPDTLIRATESSRNPIGEYGLLFIGQGKTLSCVPLGNGKFWVFNSHCVDNNNRFCQYDSKGAARLFRCVDQHAAARCLLADRPMNGAYWQLFAIHLDGA